MKIALSDAAVALNGAGRLFVELFRHGSMSVELYRPEGRDLQQPHRQDELYFIAAGTGLFRSGGDLFPFQSGDVLFVPAGVEHRFESFSEDFLEHVREFMIARKRANFMLNKAVFTGVAGSYDEENQRSAA